MHAESLALMESMLARYNDGPARVLDVGSLNVNGTYRPLVESKGWSYVGLDIVDGPNVDVVSTDPFYYPFPRWSFEVVISGSTMEHVTAVWEWVPELARLLRPGGLLAICTVTCWPIHRYPLDCWRVLPDGMEYLFDLTGVLEEYDISVDGKGNCYGSAFKRKD